MKTSFELSLNFKGGYVLLQNSEDSVAFGLANTADQTISTCYLSTQELADLSKLIDFIIGDTNDQIS